MNERIRKIESQAWGQVKRTNGLVRTEDFNEKFAELIVGECANVLQKEIKTAIAHDGKETHIDLILIEHFGVEE